MTTPDCAHEWDRFLSDPFHCVCVVCGAPFPGETPVPNHILGGVAMLIASKTIESKRCAGCGSNADVLTIPLVNEKDEQDTAEVRACADCRELLNTYDVPLCGPNGGLYRPVRSFSDLDIDLHESGHSPGWEEFGATPGGAEIERARRDAA
jgi:predicted RNA-binding Zn-ribbon protein involved in translation (DUF1610 family)